MKEQLIKSKTLKLAKEKGFKVKVKKVKIGEKMSFLGNLYNTPIYKKVEIKPTKELLKKWLREVHNIYVETNHDLTEDFTGIQFFCRWGYIQQKDKEGNSIRDGGYEQYGWEKYEDAFEVGLQNALKMIK